MANTAPPSLPEDQLLELLIQLQKTTPDQAKAILNAQPQIGYALVPLMAKMGIVNLDVLQKTLASYTGPSTSQAQAQTSIPTPVPPPVPTIPSHLTQQPPYGHHPTPPPVTNHTATPGYPPSGQPAAPNSYPGYAQAQNGGYPQQGQYSGQAQYGQQYGALGQPAPQYWNNNQAQSTNAAAGGAPGPGMLGALGNIPEDQREMIMRVISMTPEQIRSLPPQERAITLQLRATLGLPAE